MDLIFSSPSRSISVAIERKVITLQNDSDAFIKNNIHAYLISHGHMDHLGGFILNTPNDKKGKIIAGLNETISIIQNSYFNGLLWADFGPMGLKVSVTNRFHGYLFVDLIICCLSSDV